MQGEGVCKIQVQGPVLTHRLHQSCRSGIASFAMKERGEDRLLTAPHIAAACARFYFLKNKQVTCLPLQDRCSNGPKRQQIQLLFCGTPPPKATGGVQENSREGRGCNVHL